jgi:hypothetical protein
MNVNLKMIILMKKEYITKLMVKYDDEDEDKDIIGENNVQRDSG